LRAFSDEGREGSAYLPFVMLCSHGEWSAAARGCQVEPLKRRVILTGGLAAAAGAAAAACGMGDDNDENVIIHVQGTLANTAPMPDTRVDLFVAGRASALSGQGYSFLLGTTPIYRTASPSLWAVQGSLEKDILKLQGLTLIANNQNLPGAPVTVEVDIETGECAWSMGPFADGTPAGAPARGQVMVTRSSARMSGAMPAQTEGSGTPRATGGGM
jgi:hypothetical protein